MLVDEQEYIEYIKSFENVKINEALDNYFYNRISFTDLELVAMEEEDCHSIVTYSKIFKLGKFL